MPQRICSPKREYDLKIREEAEEGYSVSMQAFAYAEVAFRPFVHVYHCKQYTCNCFQAMVSRAL